jgi:uncharacterized lipoprotein YddW (UPF0748 family)
MRPLRPGIVLLAVLAVIAVAAPLTVWAFTRDDKKASAFDDQPRDNGVARADRADRSDQRCAGMPLDAPRELRGMWLTTVRNTDWPSRPGLDEQTLKNDFKAWLDLAQRLNHNAIFVQVRPSGDAFWPSAYAPWSDWLTGKRDDVSPGWDPLAFMVAETHARNLEFHAWFNPYKASQVADVNQLAPDHPIRKHPDWQITYPATGSDARLYYNPGVPDARVFVEDSILDAVRRYDIDGVHFDDFFYPYPAGKQDFPDDATFQQFGKGFSNKGDWRRDNVNKFVQETDKRIKELKPWVKFGISPFGIWRNSATDNTGSQTKGLQSFDEIYADTRKWVKEGWLDYIAPQLYWYIGFDAADYGKLLPWWSDTVKGTKVQLYIGQADYRVGQSGVWSDPDELTRQLKLNKQFNVAGTIHFTAKDLLADKLGAVARYRNAVNATPALVPAMSRLPSHAPDAPAGVSAKRGEGVSVVLTWKQSDAASYAVYKVDGQTARLVGTTRGMTWTDPEGGAAQYCVTGLDRSSNQGEASDPART